jgi:hypothetical protein
MEAYTGETQRLELPTDQTATPIGSIQHQTWALDAARRYLVSARRLLEEYQRYQAAAAQHPALQLPPEIAAIVQEVQR